MKVNIEIDCTPDEARTFFGLPDVKPMQKAAMARMEKHMLDAAAAMSPDAMLKMWLMPQNLDQVRDMFTGFFANSFGAPPRGKS